MLDGRLAPWPNFTQEEADAVSRVLLSNQINYWTGKEGRDFEIEFAEFAGTDYAIALANGTLAIDLALHGLRIGDRNGGSASDEVIVTPRTFIASASAIVNAGAIPIFADVDGETQVITPETVEPCLSSKTRAILCVHFAGWPCDMDGMRTLVQGQSVSLIEDCAQAHGALYKGRPVGGLGDVGAWSFCQDKIMTTGGEGGMVTCNDPDLWSRMWSFKDHGKSWDAVYNRTHPPGFRWVHDSIGTNWRMTEMQSVIGRIQLKRIASWQSTRSTNAAQIAQTLAPWAGEDGFFRITHPTCSGCNGSCDPERRCRHAWYRFYAFVRPKNLPKGWDRDKIITEIEAQGLPCMQGSCSEVYLEKAFTEVLRHSPKRMQIARQLGEESLMFFTHPGVEKITIDLEHLRK